MGIEIPLFPLGTVLFPHMPMRLHVFERRYRAMMRSCSELGTSFGIVGIREGHAVGRGATPYTIGTLAQIRTFEELDDGTYNLIVSGASRFRVAALATREHAYPVGDVSYLEDVSGDPAVLHRLAPRVAEAFGQYAQAIGDLSAEAVSELELPEDPELLSYLVAASLQVETNHKQDLLEVDSAEERLRGCLKLLRREALLLDKALARPASRTATISLN